MIETLLNLGKCHGTKVLNSFSEETFLKVDNGSSAKPQMYGIDEIL